jgi:hypothetical protein
LGALPQSYDPLASTLACYRLHKAAFRTGPSAIEVLRDLLEDPEVIDLDQGRPTLNDRKLARVKAFKRTTKQGLTELLIPPASIHVLVADWNRIRRDDYEVARTIVREDGRHTVQRRVRNGRTDRMICFRFPIPRE